MRAARAALPLLLIASLGGAAPPLDTATARRGALAVGERTSEQPALRAAPDASASFRLGATLRAWRNGAAAVRYDSTHTTGDGGDAEALATSCRDERIAFAALEALRSTSGTTEDQIAAAIGDNDAALVADWRARRAAAPAACR